MGMHPLVYNVYLLRECQKIWAGSSKVFHRQHACAWINHAMAHKAPMLQKNFEALNTVLKRQQV